MKIGNYRLVLHGGSGRAKIVPIPRRRLRSMKLIPDQIAEESRKIAKLLHHKHPWARDLDIENIVVVEVLRLNEKNNYNRWVAQKRALDVLREEKSSEHGIRVPRGCWELVEKLKEAGFDNTVPPLIECQRIFGDPTFTEDRRKSLVTAQQVRRQMLGSADFFA